MFAEGTRVDGYQVTRLIGKGGMGEVYLARDVALGRRVALKVVHRACETARQLEAFLTEAQITARFSHPHIVTVYGFGEHQGRPYVALEYLEGQNLRQRLRSESLGTQESVRIALAIAEALEEAHAHHVIHWDLKPANVMLPKDGRIRVVDFGIAKALPGLAHEGTVTDHVVVEGERIVGTPAYMAPERWLRAPCTARVDVWALGILLYKMLAGRHPFLTPTHGSVIPQLLTMSRERQPLPSLATAAQVPDELIELVDRCLAKDPDRRPTASAVVGALRGFLDQSRERRAAELLPYRGLLPFSERHASMFFGRGAEIAEFLERLRSQPLLAVVGPSGAGKSSFVQAGVFPRLKDQGRWLIAHFRPGNRPFEALVSCLRSLSLVGQPLPRGDGSGTQRSHSSEEAPPPGNDAPATPARSEVKTRDITPRGARPGHADASEGGDDTVLGHRAAPHLDRALPGAIRDVPPDQSHDADAPGPEEDAVGATATTVASPRLRAVPAGPARDGSTTVEDTPPPRGDDPVAARAAPPHANESPLGATESLTGELSTADTMGTPAAEDDLGTILRFPGQLGMVLQRAAERHQGKVLLLVDQFEELFSLGADPELCQRFVESLCLAADDPYRPVRIILTLRDDFLVRLAETPAGREVLAGVTVLERPGPEALHEAVVRPLEQVGYRFDDPDLVQEMIQAVRAEQACLPLLQFACSQLWARRDRTRRVVTRKAYEAIGGVEGAVARHADAAMGALTPQQLSVARALFLRLVTAERTRRILAKSQLLDGLDPEAETVLHTLTQQRALLAHKPEGEGDAETEYELIHESLIRGWARLRRWLDESGEELAFIAEAREAAQLWDKRGRPPEEVWQGAALRDATDKAARCVDLPSDVARFIAAGQRQERRRSWRTRFALAVAFAALAIVAVVVGLKEREATRARELAEGQRAEAQREGARAAYERSDLLEARAKLRGALQTRDSPSARALWWQLQRQPLVVQQQLGTMIYDVAFSPRGRTIAATSMGGAVYLMDTHTAAMRVVRGYGDQVLCVAFSPDGRTLAAGTWSGKLGLYDLAGGELRLVAADGAMLSGAAFSPDGARLATHAAGSPQHTIELRDGRSGAVTRRLAGHTGRILDMAFSPDGATLATASADKTVRLWNLDRGQSRVLGDRRSQKISVAFSPDGKHLAMASDDKTIRVLSVRTGKLVRTIRGHRGWLILKVRYSPDGSLLASAGSDATVRLWDPHSGEPRGEYEKFASEIRGLAFNPDGTSLLAGSYDGTLRLWRTTGVSHRAPAQGHSSGVTQVVFNGDGTLLASAAQDGTVGLWETATGRELRALRGHRGGVYDVAFHPQGQVLASGGTDGTVRTWDVGSGDLIKVLYGHQAAVFDVAFSPDGSVLGSAGADRSIALWDITSGTRTKRLGPSPGTVRSLSFSPDGRQIASAGHGGALLVWDVASTDRVDSFVAHDGDQWGVAFSPDGQRLASAGSDTKLRIWRIADGSSTEIGSHPGRVYWLSFHPDGTRVGTSCSNGTARIWDLQRRAAVELRGHRAEVGSVAFHPAGELAATASDDGTIRLWHTATGRPVWRAPLMRRQPAEILTHEGWACLSCPSRRVDEPSAPWRTAVDSRARVASASPGGVICLGTHDDQVELWGDHETAPLTRPHRSPRLRGVLALERGCAVLTASGAGLLHQDGRWQPLADRADAMTLAGRELLVASGTEILVFDEAGRRTGRFRGVANATALTRVEDGIVLGFRDGSLELLPLDPHDTRDARARRGFEEVPASRVRRVIAGPMKTVVVGYDNGLFGIWDLVHGARLYSAKLHGPIVHLEILSKKLYAASELGQHRVEDLAVFYQDYCDVLRDIWANVPVVWHGGLPVLEEPPAGHRCLRAPRQQPHAGTTP